MAENIRILIVDDHAIVREGQRALIDTEPGMDVVGEAVDGFEALSMIADSHPDLIFVDIMMPRLDGFGLLAKLREDENTANIPVIVLTAKTLTSEETALLANTTQQVIQKQGLAAKDLVTELGRALRIE